jgi:hypothetical protein
MPKKITTPWPPQRVDQPFGRPAHEKSPPERCKRQLFAANLDVADERERHRPENAPRSVRGRFRIEH